MCQVVVVVAVVDRPRLVDRDIITEEDEDMELLVAIRVQV